MRIEYVGHATVVVELDGVRLITDPLLRARVAHLRRRTRVDAGTLGEVTAILVSHAHYDHLDVPSLESLGTTTPIVAPKGLGVFLEKRGFTKVTEVEEGDVVPFGDVGVRAVHAEHERTRGLFGVKAPPLGYVLTGSRSVYFAGDTALFDSMSDLGSPDVALLPVWGWGPTLGRGLHLDPRSAAEALRLVKPRLAIPIHWGTYSPIHLGLRRPPAFLQLPPAEFVAAAAELAPDVEVRVLQPGEGVDVP